MIEHFSLDAVNKAATAFNTEKLNWLNQHYMKTQPASEVAGYLAWHFADQGIDYRTGPSLEQIIAVQADRVKTLKEMAAISRYFYEEYSDFDEDAAKKHLRPVAAEALELVRNKLAALSQWDAESIHPAIAATCEQLNIGMGKVGMPLRVAVTGGGNSPSLDSTLALLSQTQVVARIERALSYIQARQAQATE